MRTQLSGCAIVNDKEELLLLWKKKHKHYEFPGGKVEPNETLKETAIRECKEELGVDIIIIDYIGYENFTIDNHSFQSHKYFGKIADNQTPKVNEPAKFEKLFWLPIRQYKKYSCAPNIKEFCQKYIDRKIELPHRK